MKSNINITMTPEATYNQQVFRLLQDIKEQSLATIKGKPIKYRLPPSEEGGEISKHRRIDILYKLEESKALTVVRNKAGTRIGTGDVFYLQLHEHIFKEVYSKYEKLVEKSDKVQVVAQTRSAFEELEIIAADLEAKYKEIQSEKNDGQFFLLIAGYGKYILETKSLHPLFKELRNKAEIDVLSYKQACDEFYKEWCLLAKKLVETAEKNRIQDDPVNPRKCQIQFIKNKLGEKPQLNDDYIDHYYLPYWELLGRFEKEKKGLVTEHFVRVGEGEILVIDPLRQKANNEWEKFKTIRESQIWWAHYQIMRLTHGVFDLKEDDPYYDNDNIVDIIHKHHFEQIARGEKQSFELLKRGNFEKWITRLHNFITPRLKFIKGLKTIYDQAQKNISGTVNVISKSIGRIPQPLIINPIDGIKITPGMFENQEVRLLREINQQLQEANRNGISSYVVKLPSGTIWEDIIFKFKDDERVMIKVKGKEIHKDYKELHFADKRYSDPRPNMAWEFLKLLAKNNGEILPSSAKDRDSYKKVKQQLTDTLQEIIPLEYDPFYPFEPFTPYKKVYSYKIKMTLIPPQENTGNTVVENDSKDDIKDLLEGYTS